MEQSVDQVDRPVLLGLGLGELVTKHAEVGVEDSVRVGGVTNDRLGGSVIPTIVTPPSVLVAVSVNVVTSQQDAFLVGSEQRLPGSDRLGERFGGVSKVQLEDGVLGTVVDNVLLGERGDLPSVTKMSVWETKRHEVNRQLTQGHARASSSG